MTTPAPALGGAVKAYLTKAVSVPSTRYTYGKALNPLAEHFGPRTPLGSLSAPAIAEWFAGQWGGTADATRNLRASAIRSAATWWQEQDWVTRDLAGSLPGWKRSRTVRPGELLTSEEVQALLDACYPHSASGIRTRALIMLLYRSGLRIGEALDARPGDFDFRTHSVRLRGTKAGEAQTAGWHPSADADLMRWLDKRKALKIRQGTMFCGTKGEELTQDSVRRTLTRLAERASVEKRVHPHAFRHTFAVELRADGTPIEVISKLLRHSSVETTMLYLRKLTNGEAIDVLQLADLPGGRKPAEPETAEEKMAAMQRQIDELRARLDG